MEENIFNIQSSKSTPWIEYKIKQSQNKTKEEWKQQYLNLWEQPEIKKGNKNGKK